MNYLNAIRIVASQGIAVISKYTWFIVLLMEEEEEEKYTNKKEKKYSK